MARTQPSQQSASAEPSAVTNPQGRSVKERFFNFLMGFLGAVCVFTVGTNLLIGLDFALNYKWMAFAAASALLMLLARRTGHASWVHRAGVYAIAFGFVPTGWMSSAGLMSPSALWSGALLIPISLLITGRERILVLLAYTLLVSGLIALTYLHPDLFAELTPAEELADWLINVPVIFLFISIALIMFEREYEAERRANRDQARQLARLSMTDSLTGLLNRQNLASSVAEIWQQARRRNDTAVAIFADIDRFKEYNDRYGHGQGDICLTAVARVLASVPERQAQDLVFRYGGEEFLLLLPGADMDDGLRLARRLQQELDALRLPHAASDVASHVTLSMGLAEVNSTDSSPQTWLDRADAALYRAKQAGRNRIATADATSLATASRAAG